MINTCVCVNIFRNSFKLIFVFFVFFFTPISEPVLKKLVCHSFTLSRLNNEWVEIDVRQVIKYWEKMYRASLMHNKGGAVADPMVAIDVEDEYQQPLKAGLFFEPTDCQACKCVVFWERWSTNFYINFHLIREHFDYFFFGSPKIEQIKICKW